MFIYKTEANSGLAEKIKANTSIAYNTLLQPWEAAERNSILEMREDLISHSSKASVNDSDLFGTKSILVSTNWNKNDDVFEKAESWLARHTASHKPTNLEHDEKQVVGHITDTWALDNGGIIIPDNSCVDDLPDLYHIANGAVIYTTWEDKKLVERTEKLIAEINEGTKYVSMECLFRNFAYAVITPEKEYYVIDRNEETSWLTKALRIYGGKGEFDGCTIGRLLRNITFSGKGYVDSPANENSVIFNDTKPFNSSKASYQNPFKTHGGVFINRSKSNVDNVENKDMTVDTVEILKQTNDKNEKVIASLSAKVEELTKANSEAGVKSLEQKVSELEATIAKMDEDKKEKDKKYDEAKASLDELTKELDTVKAANKELEEKAEAAELEKVKSHRISSLVDGGVDKTLAEKKVELYAGLNDEQFEAVASDIVEAHKTKSAKDEKDKEKEDKTEAGENLETDEAEAKASDETLENAETSEEAPLSSDASEDNEESATASLRTDLSKAFAAHFGIKQEDK